MAIAFDAASSGYITNVSSSSMTVSHTCSGSDRILVVAVACYAASGGDVVSGITYNGTAMTFVAKEKGNGTNTNTYSYLYYLVAPATGANNIVVSFSSNITYAWLAASSYTGAAQTGQPDASDSATSGATTSTTVTDTITSVADNCWAVMGGFNNNATTWTAGANTTIRAQSGGSANRQMICDNNAAKTPAGSITLTATCSSSQPWATVIITIAPAGAAPSGNIKKLNGVLWANVKKFNGIAKSNIKKINGIAAK